MVCQLYHFVDFISRNPCSLIIEMNLLSKHFLNPQNFEL